MVDLSVSLGKLVLTNPVMNASGTYGYGEEYSEYVPLNRLGAFVTKTITKEAKQGNPPPRVYETPSGMLNSIGLENVGVRRLLEEYLPRLESIDTKVIVSVGGNSLQEYQDVARILSGEKRVDGLELNLSCPNVQEGGLHFGRSDQTAGQLVKAVRETTDLFMSVKLSPSADVLEVAKACREAGCDCVSLINTIPGMAVNIRTRRPWLGGITGGLSGPAIRPVAVYWVYRLRRELDISIIGIGGIMTGEDALEFIIAGASAIQIGTGNFVDPETPLKVIEGISRYCECQGVDRLSSLIGCLSLEELPHRNQTTE